MGVHSAFFGPSKYGLLPELLPEKRLSWGNGILELGTFLAIITGMVARRLDVETFRGRQAWSGRGADRRWRCVGTGLQPGITRVPAADPRSGSAPISSATSGQQMRVMRGDRVARGWRAAATSISGFSAQLLQLNLISYGRTCCMSTRCSIGYLSAALALGIGLGSFAAGYLVRRQDRVWPCAARRAGLSGLRGAALAAGAELSTDRWS